MNYCCAAGNCANCVARWELQRRMGYWLYCLIICVVTAAENARHDLRRGRTQ